MSKKTNLDELVLLSEAELDGRVAACLQRKEDRDWRATVENRSMTSRETALTQQDADELSAIRDALELKAARRDQLADMDAARQTQQRMGQIAEAMNMRGRLSPLCVSPENLRALEDARRDYRSMSVLERSALDTTALGTAVEYSAGGLAAPNTLWRLSGIPTVEPPAGLAGTVPQVTLPSGTALVNESTAHAEFDAIEPDPVTMARTGAWSDITSEALVSTSLAEISAAHSRIIARDIDLAAVTKLEQSPGALTIDEALATVAAEAATDTSRLWIFGTPSSIATLAGNATFAATNASDTGSYATAYGGSRIYVTPAASDDLLTVFYPGGFKAFATPLASATVIDPTKGAQRFGSWMLWGLGQSLVGAAVTVDLGGAVSP